ncbi:stage III sporulation protein AH [Sporosarcina sp. NCCP-2716]|uniref:SpoIIIAH-like family protein n=1 Tax=Sporosarcina sp. NCCP-2716 TaxID=2943679 RepID=UPI00203B15ED|nr:SpoIIIAH-like family protein [Sporosarcina sp. NCCP-2716]GKV68113.1 stage III sporulation protein AH [Sporosarcina sp. NCCP-2716]
MRTNKRTVWFLTLMSLVAVISIYYIKEKAPMSFDGIQIFSDDLKGTADGKKTDADKKTPVFANSYVFEEMRMVVRDERSKLQSQLNAKMTSPDYSAEEKNDAMNEMAELTKRESAEALLELQIKALGYPEAFVKTDNNDVNVTVLSTEGHSAKLAAEITQYVKASWDGAQQVSVEFKGNN